MKGTDMPETNAMLASFIQRLEPLEEIVRHVMSNQRMSVLFTFRGMHEKKVLLDFTRTPARVVCNGDAAAGNVYATVDGRVMHEIFLGRLKPGVALGRRELLLRGNVWLFSKVIPLFDVAPVLYREHLADIHYTGYARFAADGRPEEAIMSSPLPGGETIPATDLSGGERFAARIINALAYVLGFAVGVVRFRVFKKLSVFGVLASMSRGLAAATPKELKGG